MRANDKIEAESLLRKRMDEMRQRTYEDLLKLLDKADVIEVGGETDKKYQIEINAAWEDATKTRLHVSGSIDDGGLRAWINWSPLVQSFIAFPDGRTE